MIYMVGKEGFEPSLLQQKLDFESSASTIPPLAHRVNFIKKIIFLQLDIQTATQ